jgi:hypothetical protein
MRLRWMLLTALITTTALTAAPQIAIAQTCVDLWIARNAIYKARGYCFKTQLATNYFGKGGCKYEDEDQLPLTPAETNRIHEITAQESKMSCRVNDNIALTDSSVSCDQLWVERNFLYKKRGYCFRTPRAITYFGNTGCSVQNESDVPLSPTDRARISQIAKLERAYVCN